MIFLKQRNAGNKGLASMPADGIKSQLKCYYKPFVPAESSLFSFCIYLRLWGLYRTNVPAETALNSGTPASPYP